MPRIIYVEHNGTEHEIEVAVGENLMQGAVNHLVPGIEGDCGGLCACSGQQVAFHRDPWPQSCNVCGRNI